VTRTRRLITIAAALPLLAGVSVAQLTWVTPVRDEPTQGRDFATFRRDVTHFTFDVNFDPLAPAFWTGTEMRVRVVGPGRIWHASDQFIPDPNWCCYSPYQYATNNNLFPPPQEPPAGDTLRFDTMFAAPPVDGWFGQPQFAALYGVYSGDDAIFYNSRHGHAPLAWFTLRRVSDPMVGARLTFLVPSGWGDLSLDPTGRTLFATLVGRTTSSVNPGGVSFALSIYQREDCDLGQHPEEDCNNNGLLDSCEIVDGAASDSNRNGVPDECDCDVDGDAYFGLSDLARLLTHFGRESGASRAEGDMDGDGAVGSADLAIVLANFGAHCL
jgi:hypothetical protein